MAKKKLTKIGRYRILGELGRGAMGIVYGAEDPALDRTVALKTIILSDEVEGRKEFHKRFFLEAKAAGKLTHPNIITVYDFGEEGDLAYLAMEFLKGIELRAKMLQGPIPVVEAVDIAEQVADGLAYAHELGIVLYEMLTRASLFAGADTPQILHNVVHIEHVPPSRLNREVPSMLDFVIARALKKDPAVRYQDVYELAADLRSCLAELGGRKRAEKDEDGDRDVTKTVKLDVDTEKTRLAPATRAIGSDTRLPLSRQFDSSLALGRLSAPTKRDRELLARPPRPVGFFRRLKNDPGPRLLFIAVLAAALVGSAIAL